MKATRISYFLYIIFALAQCSQLTNAYFCQGTIYTKRMPNGKTQHLVLIGEDHKKRQPQQTEDLLESMPESSVVIAEDKAELLEKLGYTLKHNYNERNEGLSGLVNIVRKRKPNVKAINVEFRSSDIMLNFFHDQQLYFSLMDRRSGSGPFFFNTDFCNVTEHIKKYLADMEQWKKETMHYNDGTVFNNAYEQLRESMEEPTRNVKWFLGQAESACKKSHASFPVNFSRISPLNEFLDSICYELDIRILHQIYTHQDREYIFVCAGYYHTDNIEKALIRFGYRCIEDNFYPGKYKVHYNKIVKTDDIPIDIKKLLSKLPANEPNKKDDSKFALHHALTATCLLPGFKFAQQPWSNSWKKYKPTAPYSLDQLRKLMTKNPQTQSLNLVDQLRKFLDVKKRVRVLKPTTHILQKRPLPFNFALRVRNLPRAFKVGAAATVGIGLANLYRSK